MFQHADDDNKTDRERMAAKSNTYMRQLDMEQAKFMNEFLAKAIGQGVVEEWTSILADALEQWEQKQWESGLEEEDGE